MGLTAEEQQRVVAIARSWLGTPFHPHARARGVGVDCANLLVAIYSEAGLFPSLAVRRLPTDWHLHTATEWYVRTVQDYADRIDPPWEPGDVLVYRGPQWPSAGHGGIYVGGGRIIHAVAAHARSLGAGSGGVQEWPVDTPLLATSFDSAWRLRCPR
jgi:cell wall-associated NlpC family hydrolase